METLTALQLENDTLQESTSEMEERVQVSRVRQTLIDNTLDQAIAILNRHAQIEYRTEQDT